MTDVAEQTPSATLEWALVAAQREAGQALRDSRNPQLGAKYASAEEMIRVAREALGAHGLALVLVESEIRAGDPPILRTSHWLVHEAGRGREIVSEMPICERKGTPLDKATAIARTFGLGYVLRDLLLIPRVDELDNADAHDDTAHAKTAKTPPPARPVHPPRETPPSDLQARVAALVERMGGDWCNAHLPPPSELAQMTRQIAEARIRAAEEAAR